MRQACAGTLVELGPDALWGHQGEHAQDTGEDARGCERGKDDKCDFMPCKLHGG